MNDRRSRFLRTPSARRRAAAALTASVVAIAVLGALATATLEANAQAQAAPAGAASGARPALTVNVVRPERATLPLRISANGNVAAWQEAVVGTEANGLRIADVRVNVGDAVRRGQALATFSPETVQVELAQQRASVVEAEAMLADASANAERARSLQATGALSEAAINQYFTAERTARARLDAQRAATRARQLRVAQTAVLAPDDGVISARTATVGAVVPAGQELFRMIRKGRLEWRAEVPSVDLGSVQAGMKVAVQAPNGPAVTGTVRMVAPTVDPQTRNGIVYVDVPAGGSLRAGMFARGEFELGASQATTLPQSAVLLRDGFSYVMQVGPDNKIAQKKVQTGRRIGDRIELTGSVLPPETRVVAQGGGFLVDGDLVRVVEPAPAARAVASSGIKQP